MNFETPIARATDPRTSHTAALRVTASGARQKHAETLLATIRRHPDLTAMELADTMIRNGVHWLVAVQTASKRISDLEAANAIRCTGERLCAVTEHRARTWVAV